ncbi:MAG: hypothetical protein ACO4AI_02645 [Prochlorothrix sp.]|nr:hypothetical protein [Prochlorothrix sp.]
MSEKTNLTRCFFLVSRNQYQTCHVKLEGDDTPLGAIHVQGENYGFLRKADDAEQALRFILKLNAKDTAVALTQTAVGYMLWTLEPGSTPTRPLPAKPREAAKSFYLYEAERSDFVQIRVPDLDQDLVATFVMGRYYSVFKVEEEADKALEIVGRLTQQGDEITVAMTRKGYAICVLEPDAFASPNAAE